jgi:hypothetical protein
VFRDMIGINNEQASICICRLGEGVTTLLLGPPRANRPMRPCDYVAHQPDVSAETSLATLDAISNLAWSASW